MSLKKVAILIILPDIKTTNDIDNWNNSLNKAHELYNLYPSPKNQTITTIERWAIGYVAWKKIINMLQLNNVDVYFLRTDFRLINQAYKIEDNIINIKYNSNYGTIIYKTLFTLKLLENHKYSYYVRGNLNTIIDIYTLSNFVQLLPERNIFSSPFYEGNSYPFGYFILISNDIAKYLINLTYENRLFNEDTADDYEITNIILKKFKYCILDGCEIPLSYSDIITEEKKTVNNYGIHFCRNNIIEPTDTIIKKIKESKNSIFLYRLKELIDNDYANVYKVLIKHIWNKVISCRYNNLIIYNETNNIVPHNEYERDEQLLVARYIEPNDIVLELGARYGSVSCIINKIINIKTNQVSVEPDITVLDVLHKNKKLNNCNFHIFNGIITSNSKYNKLVLNGYGSTIDINNNMNKDIYNNSININCISLDNLQQTYNLNFNVLVADCEGFLEIFLNENKCLYNQLNKIIFECDRPDVCNYNNIKTELLNNNFKLIENGFQCVFIK
jgi:hypothetical protein